jgi:hypothetical protein
MLSVLSRLGVSLVVRATVSDHLEHDARAAFLVLRGWRRASGAPPLSLAPRTLWRLGERGSELTVYAHPPGAIGFIYCTAKN